MVKNDLYQALLTVDGIGPMKAVAVISAVEEGRSVREADGIGPTLERRILEIIPSLGARGVLLHQRVLMC
jgi:hypothetical protein